MAFEFTSEKASVANAIWAYTSAAGAGVCFLVLLVIGTVSLHLKARAHLDRVSFRIVAYALIANLVFGISSAVGGTFTGPSSLCGVSILFLQYTLHFSNFLFFCIALNLQLVVVHSINGRAMEKYYYIFAALLSLVLVVPPFATGQYGWDPLQKVCWYANANVRSRIIWQMTTQMAWTSLSVLGEVICSIVVLVFMIRHNNRHRRIFSPVKSTSETNAPQVLHANRYKNIIFRISLYPIVSCLVNLMSVVTALHSTFSNGIQDQTDYNVFCLSSALYGGRAIVYGLLALTDPALVRGMKALYSQYNHGKDMTTSITTSTTSSSNHGNKTRPTRVFVELTTFSAPEDPVLPNDVSIAKGAAGHATTKPELDHERLDPSNGLFTAGHKMVNDSTVGFADDVESRTTALSTDLQLRNREEHRRRQEESEAFKKQI
ncbi:hypothetical protein ONZ45_g15322 [Pleurotus djamor]|nr:hypothetical protein ONZ45_g15322 [Pleurotus djamor]